MTGSVLLLFPFASSSDVAQHSTSQGAGKPQGVVQFPGDGKNRAVTTAKAKEMKGKRGCWNLEGECHVEKVNLR